MRVGLLVTVLAFIAACGGGRARTGATVDPFPEAGARPDASPTHDASRAHDGSARPDARDGDDASRRDGTPPPDADGLELLITVSPLKLTPGFSPSIHDYSMRCAAGSNALTVAMTAASGGTIALEEPVASTPAPAATASVDVLENQALVIDASAVGATTEYWIRCLPHDFPAIEWDEEGGAGAATPGYYLVGTAEPPAGTSGYAIVLDSHGVPVWYAAGRGEAIGVGDVDDVVNGAISFYSQPGHPAEVVELSPLALTYAAPEATVLDPHELQVLPNGDFIVLSNPIESGVDLTGLAIPGAHGGVNHLGPNSKIAACNLVEFEPTTGRIVWSWLGDDHFDPVEDSTAPDYLGSAIDTYHCNSIDIDPANGNLLVSARNMDSVFYVERPGGAILWKLGGKPYTKDGAPYVAAADPFFRQHDARLQPGWSTSCGGYGQVSVFDDHTDEAGPARAVVYDVVVGSGDAGVGDDGGSSGGCGTVDAGARGATVAWEFSGLGNSSSRGSFRILADGSHVIGWGKGATSDNSLLTEVDVDGNAVRGARFTDGDVSYRAIKVPLTTLDLAVLHSTAGTR